MTKPNNIIDTDGLTVRELRRLLFEVENQDAQVHFITKYQYGEIVTTRAISSIRTITDEDGATQVVAS
tara:strand:+ start:183 stop:386 length:204 start_codon:yes stop_codon:yes gene_type:complete